MTQIDGDHVMWIRLLFRWRWTKYVTQASGDIVLRHQLPSFFLSQAVERFFRQFAIVADNPTKAVSFDIGHVARLCWQPSNVSQMLCALFWAGSKREQHERYKSHHSDGTEQENYFCSTSHLSANSVIRLH